MARRTPQQLGEVATVLLDAATHYVLVSVPDPTAADPANRTVRKADPADLAVLAGSVTLPDIATPGDYFTVTIDAKGRVTAGEADPAAARVALGLAAVAASGSAADLGAGTLPDARLSSNVPLKNAANAYAAAQTFNSSVTVNGALLCVVPDGQSGGYKDGSAAETGQAFWAIARRGSLGTWVYLTNDGVFHYPFAVGFEFVGGLTVTGTITVPTPTAAGHAATKGYVDTAVAGLINSAPGALDTLKELADALGDDANYAATVTAALGAKAPLASPALTGTPTAPTADPGTDTTQIATTAFVAAAVAAGGGQAAGVRASAVLPNDAGSSTAGNTTLNHSPALQAVLTAGKPLIVDRPCVVPVCLDLPTGARVEWVGDGQLIKPPYNHPQHDSAPVLRNANPVAYPGTRVDKNIVLVNPRIDQNRRNGGAGGKSYSDTVALGFAAPYANASAEVVPTIGLYGCEDVAIYGGRIDDNAGYAYHFGHCCNVNGYGVRVERVDPGTPVIPGGNDAWHLNGGCEGVNLWGSFGSNDDDWWAFNAADGNDVASPPITFAAGTVAHGPIKNCRVVGVRASYSGAVGRFLTAYQSEPITNVTVEDGVYESTQQGINCDTFDVAAADKGLADGITLCNLKITHRSQYNTLYFNRTRFRNLVAENITVAGLITAKPILVSTNAILQGACRFADVTLSDAAGTVAAQPVQLLGLWDDLEIARLSWVRPTTAPALDGAAVEVNPGSSLSGPVRVLGGAVARVRSVVTQTGGVFGGLTVGGGLVHSGSAGGSAVHVPTGVTLPRLRTGLLEADHYAEVVSGGVLTQQKHDGSGWYTRLWRDWFGGSAGANLSGSTASSTEATWPADGTHEVGGGAIKKTGDGWLYLGGGDSYHIASVQPTLPFEVEFDWRRLTTPAGSPWTGVTLLSDAAHLSSMLWLEISGSGLELRDNIGGANLAGNGGGLPALGVAWRVRVKVADAGGGSVTATVSVSTDGGVTWSNAFAPVTVASALSPGVGFYFSVGSGSAWTASTGYQVGRMVVRSAA